MHFPSGLPQKMGPSCDEGAHRWSVASKELQLWLRITNILPDTQHINIACPCPIPCCTCLSLSTSSSTIAGPLPPALVLYPSPAPAPQVSWFSPGSCPYTQLLPACTEHRSGSSFYYSQFFINATCAVVRLSY